MIEAIEFIEVIIKGILAAVFVMIALRELGVTKRNDFPLGLIIVSAVALTAQFVQSALK